MAEYEKWETKALLEKAKRQEISGAGRLTRKEMVAALRRQDGVLRATAWLIAGLFVNVIFWTYKLSFLMWTAQVESFLVSCPFASQLAVVTLFLHVAAISMALISLSRGEKRIRRIGQEEKEPHPGPDKN